MRPLGPDQSLAYRLPGPMAESGPAVSRGAVVF